METLESYVGIEPFTVVVDASTRLDELAQKARYFRDLPFDEKLQATKKLTHEGIPLNAYELWIANNDESAKQIVLFKHPLSKVLETGIGCCRYQGALFFVLGYEAQLGESHFLQAAPVNNRLNTVFNQILQNGKKHTISIFTEGLKDKSHDYSLQNPRVFEQAFQRMPGYKMYSYHSTPNGVLLIANMDEHPCSIE